MTEKLVNSRAEEIVLGAILVRNDLYETVSEILTPADFGIGVHGRIFARIGEMRERGETVNPISLRIYFEQDEAMRRLGGVQYLIHLVANITDGQDAVEMARQIFELARRRHLVAFGHKLMEEAQQIDGTTSDEVIESIERKLLDLAERREDRGPTHIGASVVKTIAHIEAAHKNGGRITGITTGLADLDRAIGGLQTELIVVAGRPSMGKSSLADGFAFAAGRAGIGAAIFSLEMTDEQIIQREIARYTGITTDRQVRGDLTPNDFMRVVDAQQQIEKLPIFIDDTPGLGITRIRQRVRRLMRRHKIGLVVIDHLQLMHEQGQENRRLEIGAITSGSKALSKEFGIPVVLVSQLSRAVEAREDKRPTLADLRESGDIEQDADVVMFVFREEYYLSRAEPLRRADESDQKFNDRYASWQARLRASHGLAEIIIAKRRNGATGTIKVHWDAQKVAFSNLAHPHHSPQSVA